jgi:hypothetical protein
MQDVNSVSLIPAHVELVFGDPPLLRGEDDGIYYTLMERFAELVEPKDMIEWWWVKDMTDHTWEIRRLRRFKVLFVELGRDEVLFNRRLIAHGDEKTVPESEKDIAEFFKYHINQYKDLDKLIASAEARRDRTLREIERRRDDLARRLREASNEIVNGKDHSVAAGGMTANGERISA